MGTRVPAWSEIQASLPRVTMTTPDGPAQTLARVFICETLSAASAERVEHALNEVGLLDLERVESVQIDELTHALPLGRRDAVSWSARFHRLARWYVSQGCAQGLSERGTVALRESLRSVRGLGPVLVEALLLESDELARPTFPVERGSLRIAARHGWIDPTEEYDEAVSRFVNMGGGSRDALRQMRASFRAWSRRYCRAREACCETCPLRRWLPESGPYALTDED